MVNKQKGEHSVFWPFARQKRTNFLLSVLGELQVFLFISMGNMWVSKNDKGVWKEWECIRSFPDLVVSAATGTHKKKPTKNNKTKLN